jgi:hypothetical protein
MCLETGSGVSVARVRSPLQYRFNILNGDREGGTTTFARKFLPKYANRTNFVFAPRALFGFETALSRPSNRTLKNSSRTDTKSTYSRWQSPTRDCLFQNQALVLFASPESSTTLEIALVWGKNLKLVKPLKRAKLAWALIGRSTPLLVEAMNGST